MQLQLIGTWIQTLDDEDFPPPQELVYDYEPATREAIARYLDAGYQFESYRGMWYCLFSHDVCLGNCELTDGLWVWQEGLSHYVREHNVRLPDEFIATALSQTRPILPQDYEPSATTLDDSYWITWCTANRSNSLHSRLLASRRVAEAQSIELRRNRIAERERLEGLSNRNCQWAGCQNRALAGRVLCAKCLLEPEASWRVRREDLNSDFETRKLIGEGEK